MMITFTVIIILTNTQLVLHNFIQVIILKFNHYNKITNTINFT